jgi:tol-pal system protein YbgF
MPLPSKALLSFTTASLLIALVQGTPRAGDGGGADAYTAMPAAQQAPQLAQLYGRPPADIGDGQDLPYSGDSADGGAQDSASLLIRIGRLESQMRQINGQLEQMQFEARKLQEQLRKFQEDVDFRFRENAPGSSIPKKHGEAAEPETYGENRAAAQAPVQPSSRPERRGDAFDPSEDPSAPGAPRPLGSFAPASITGAASPRKLSESPAAAAEPSDPGAPLDIFNGRSRAAAGGPLADTTPPAATVIAAPPGSPRQEFDIALAYLKQRAYENAEKGFAGFLAKNPQDKLASDAIYYLGESFYLRGRQREAAEQYLKISTKYANSPRAPQALLRLGQSLNALGARDQACATFGEIARKYPNAPAMVKTGADREAKRAQC